MELACFAPHIVCDEEKNVKKLQMGLRTHLRDRLSALCLKTLVDVSKTTMAMERECEALQKLREQNNKKKTIQEPPKRVIETTRVVEKKTITETQSTL